MSSAGIQETSELANKISVNMGSEDLNTELSVSGHSYDSEDSDLSSGECWDSVDNNDYGGRSDTFRLPRQGHELKRGRLIEKRGSSQEKFNSPRPKALVKYGKQQFSATADDIDEEAKAIINEFVEKYHYFNFIDMNAIIVSGERSVLIHVPGRLDENTGLRSEFLIKVYRHQYGIDRCYQWGLNEYRNAHRMWNYANVPNVYCPTRNVTTLNFIGDDGTPAPNLNEVSFEITEKMYEEIITTMHKLYNEGKMVHGKLSANTILWWRDKLWFISISHAVETSNPNALQMLMKDCCHITHVSINLPLVFLQEHFQPLILAKRDCLML